MENAVVHQRAKRVVKMSHSKEEILSEIKKGLEDAQLLINTSFQAIREIIKEKGILEGKKDIEEKLVSIKKRIEYTLENWNYELKD